MSIVNFWRRPALALLTGAAIATCSLAASIAVGSLTPAIAQVAEEFRIALEPYGTWRRHARYGEVWVPDGLPSDWRPYEYGHWVYTEEWGWYWVSDDTEQDWGWVTYHYGRWVFERRIGWFWVPGEEWAPAWVDWRYGDEYVGWAALPPDDLIDGYDSEPALWVFVQGRYITAPRLRGYIVSAQRRAVALRGTRLVNRTFAPPGARLAVNPGLSPAFVAGITRAPVAAYRVRPRVFITTQGVAGAVPVRPEDLRGQRGRNPANAVSVQRTNTLIKGAPSAPPQPLGKGEPGRLGANPPSAVQGNVAPKSPQQAPVIQRQAPTTPPPPAPTPPRIATPPRVAPTVAPTTRQGEPPPQAKPARPTAPQTPPPPQPAQSRPQAPQPAPPPRPVAPTVRPATPPPAARPASPPKPPDGKGPLPKPGEPEDRR